MEFNDGKKKKIIIIQTKNKTQKGSSLLSLPWGFGQAGFIGGIICVIAIGFITMYTAYLILKYSVGKIKIFFFF